MFLFHLNQKVFCRALMSFVLYIGLIAYSLESSAAENKTAEVIPLYTDYSVPPFSTDKGGWTSWLADWLTKQSGGRYYFQPTFMPRNRLNFLLSQPDWQGLLYRANPLWFGDQGQKLLLWSTPYIGIMQFVVSHKDKPVQYVNPDSVKGLKLGGVLGWSYRQWKALLNQNLLHRDDSETEESALEKLRYKRVDVAVLHEYSLSYLRTRFPDLKEWLYIANVPYDSRPMYFATGRNQQQLMAFVNSKIPLLKNDPAWQKFTKVVR